MSHTRSMKYVTVLRPKPFLKISVSNAPDEQFKLSEIAYAFESADATAIASVVHELLKDESHGGKWFDISLPQAIEAIEAVASKWVEPQHKTPQSFLELLEQLKGEQSREDFAEELGVTYWRVLGWFRHDTVPPRHWGKIQTTAEKRRRSDITWELLTKLYRQKEKKRKPAEPG